jgi:hypothetical protein
VCWGLLNEETEKSHIAEHATREEQISGDYLESTRTGTTSMNHPDYGPGGSSFVPQLKSWSLRPPAGDGIMVFNVDQSRKTTS